MWRKVTFCFLLCFNELQRKVTCGSRTAVPACARHCRSVLYKYEVELALVEVGACHLYAHRVAEGVGVVVTAVGEGEILLVKLS